RPAHPPHSAPLGRPAEKIRGRPCGLPLSASRRKEEEEDPAGAATQQLYLSPRSLESSSSVKHLCNNRKDGRYPSGNGCFRQSGCGGKPFRGRPGAWKLAC